MLPDPDFEGAAEAYESAIRGAAAGGIRLTELMARAHLVELRREQGHSTDGTEELAALYATFTDGFDEKVLEDARRVMG